MSFSIVSLLVTHYYFDYSLHFHLCVGLGTGTCMEVRGQFMGIEPVLSSYQGFLGIKLRLERLGRNLLSTLVSLYPSVLEIQVLIIYKHSITQKRGYMKGGKKKEGRKRSTERQKRDK